MPRKVVPTFSLPRRSSLGSSCGDAEPERDGSAASHETNPADVRAKVSRFVQDKGINYRVLLDPRSIVGRRFNGGELPTTVLIDSQGFVRRRFIGGREVAVFESLIRGLDPKAAGR